MGADAQVTTDSDGLKYLLMDNIGDLEPGTYMVRFEGRDYGAVSGSDYVTASSAVFTATEEPKLSGEACTNCHGATVMHLQGSYAHYQPFNTDGCLACHDKSGNHADYIGNRAHAVHSASATGDLALSGGLPRNWSEVTFPQDVNNCTICHTDTAVDTPVWRNPNEVVCGGCHGTVRNPDPADYPDVAPAQLDKEAAAAHMEDMLGVGVIPWDPTTLDVTRQCIVCHGEDRIADLYVTHDLIRFPPPEVPEP